MEIKTSLTGDWDLQRVFDKLPAKVQLKVLRPAVAEFADKLTARIKQMVPRRLGSLAYSIGAKVTASTKRTTVSGIVGSRKGFYLFSRSGKLTTTRSLRKATAKGRAAKAVGSRYLHLVENPHATRSGGMTHGARFMAAGQAYASQAGLSYFQDRIKSGIEREAAALAAQQ